jgi:hypothetical protein
MLVDPDDWSLLCSPVTDATQPQAAVIPVKDLFNGKFDIEPTKHQHRISF